MDTSELDTKDARNHDMPDELPLDTNWDEIYTVGTPSGTSNDYNFDELLFIKVKLRKHYKIT